MLHASSSDGYIQRIDPAKKTLENWVSTGGRPLGLEFDAKGTLWVADAYKGLVEITPDGQVRVACDKVGDSPILYADDVDIAADGRVFFTDASTHFGAEAIGDTLLASKLAVMEHSGDGRLLVYDPSTQVCRVALPHLNFANGVAVSADQSFLALVDTAEYRVLKYFLSGPRAGQTETLIEGLPGFPDNISLAPDGHFWIGLISPRSEPVDLLAGWPFVRKIVWRLPDSMKPDAKRYGHVIKVSAQGDVIANLQDPAGGYAYATGALEVDGTLYVTSLKTPALGILPAP